MKIRDLQFDPFPNWPAWIVAASLGILWFAWFANRNTARLGVVRGLLLNSMRLCGVVILFLLLLRPQRREELPVEKRETLIIAGIDTSQSMEQTDAGNRKRIDAATRLIQDAKLDDPRFHWVPMTFDEDASRAPGDKSRALAADGKDSRFHTSVMTMLQQARSGAKADQSLILFTDGHDFEMTSATRTGLAARARSVTIHAVPFGTAGQVRDVAVRMAGSQPYCYLKQKARISAIARLAGCENEFLTAQLLRNGKLVDSKSIPTRNEMEVPIEFVVTETEAGQAEYEVRITPLVREVETGNNSTITYLNVLDDKLRVLLVEGAPYWDTTFLQRSLIRNDKMDLDALIQIQPRKLRRIRKSQGSGTLEPPETRADFEAYDVVILGAKCAEVLPAKAQAGLVDYVREAGGVIICARGPSGLDVTTAAVLDPVVWMPADPSEGELTLTREGRGNGPLGLLASFSQDARRLPALTNAFSFREKRDLAAVLAETKAAGADKGAPALIHRPVGRGQVLALGAGDLWRWSLSSDVAAREAVYDRVWDQIIVWLLAGTDRVPGSQMRLRASAANLPLGEAVHFRLQLTKGMKFTTPPVVEITGGGETERVTMENGGDAAHFDASHVPAKPGRYEAKVTLPDGRPRTARFMVYQENREQTEVSTDRAYLKKLCDASGGQVIEPDQFVKFIDTLKAGLQSDERRFKQMPLWDDPRILLLIVTLLGLEWYLRRRWGLS